MSIATAAQRSRPAITTGGASGEIFGDEVVAAAMIDRLVHHAEILGLKGDSYRLRDKDLGSPPPRD
jgi:DNA replication protein DnaC